MGSPTGITVPGPAGNLDGMLTRAARDTGRAAVLCHPHPQFGGSMHDAVLDAVERVLLAEGVHCVRFDFRGVGNSAGRFDGGNGETDDALAVLGWLRGELPDARETWLAGYSFGSHVAWRAAQSSDDVARVLLVAPPFGRMDFAAARPDLPVQVIGGDADAFIDWPALGQWCEGRGKATTVARLPGVDHFFRTGSAGLADAVRAACEQRT